MRAKNWTALQRAQRRATLGEEIRRYEAAIDALGEPADRHQRRSLSMWRRSLRNARTELLLVNARIGVSA
jgi:hypothetical protein